MPRIYGKCEGWRLEGQRPIRPTRNRRICGRGGGERVQHSTARHSATAQLPPQSAPSEDRIPTRPGEPVTFDYWLLYGPPWNFPSLSTSGPPCPLEAPSTRQNPLGCPTQQITGSLGDSIAYAQRASPPDTGWLGISSLPKDRGSFWTGKQGVVRGEVKEESPGSHFSLRSRARFSPFFDPSTPHPAPSGEARRVPELHSSSPRQPLSAPIRPERPADLLPRSPSGSTLTAR